MILVTGGAGFIGSNFVLNWLVQSDESIVNLDKLTYAGNLKNLASIQGDSRHQFVQGDIGDAHLIARILKQHQPRAIINFAAESHVDRSIHGPEDFIQTNILGTFRLLEVVRGYWGNWMLQRSGISASCTYLLTKSMVLWREKKRLLPNSTAISLIVLIQPARLPVIIWCAPIIIPMACRL